MLPLTSVQVVGHAQRVAFLQQALAQCAVVGRFVGAETPRPKHVAPGARKNAKQKPEGVKIKET
jgi:hypothetical protein